MKNSYFLVVLLILLSTSSLNAQWTKLDGPFGGVSAGSIIEKDNYIFVYLNTSQADVYRSDDNGANWESLDSDFFKTKAVQDFFVDNGTLYAATTKGLVYSEDNGNTWIDDSTKTGYSYVLVVDKLDSLLYLGSTGGILYNNLTDSLGWIECNDGLTNSTTNDFVTTDDYIFAATYDGIFRKSTIDSSWTEMKNGLPENTTMYSLFAKDSYIFASSNSYIYRTSDNGENWTKLTLPIEDQGNDFLLMDGKLFLATFSGIMVSEDNGDTWREINTGLPFGASYCIDLTSSGNRLFLSTAWGIYYTDNIDESWIKIDLGINNLDISDLQIDGNVLYALTADDGIYKTDLNVIDWDWFINGLENKTSNTLFLDQGDIYLGSRNGFNSYNQETETWNSFINGFNEENKYDYFDIKSISRIDNILFAGTEDQGLYKAHRDTLVWTLIESEIPGVESQVTIDTTIYAALHYGSYILKSEDFGKNWDLAADQVYMSSGVLYNFDNDIYAACDNGIFYLPQNDTNWIDISYNLTYVFCNSLAKNDKGLFSSVGASLYHLPAGDTTWTEIKGELPSGFYSIALNSEKIFVSVGKSGVWSAPLADIYTGIETDAGLSFIPENFRLYQNYPNPFNPSTNIKYSIPAVRLSGVEAGRVILKIYDQLGKEIKTLVNEYQSPGNYEIKFNAFGLSSGVYFYRITTGDFVDTKKMLLLK